jgi:hypothetical protein
VDPMGTVRVDLGSAEGVTVGDVDLAMTAQVRSVLPSLSNRRDDVFAARGPVLPVLHPADAPLMPR